MKTLRILSALPALVLCALTALAQTPENPAKKNYVHTLTMADRIQIRIFQEEELTTLARVDARGRINLQLYGELAVGGMTIPQAQAAVENAYKEGRYLRNPQVTINVEEYAPREVSINGQVRSSGRYQLPNESTYTLSELITKAGGITDIGKGSAVTVSRTLPDGTKKTFTIDVDSIIKGKKGADEDFVLQSGDLVFVPERLI